VRTAAISNTTNPLSSTGTPMRANKVAKTMSSAMPLASVDRDRWKCPKGALMADEPPR